MKFKYPMAIPILIFGLPLILCAFFKIVSLGSIGPLVLITGIINLFALPPLLYFCIRDYFPIGKWKIAIVVSSGVLGAVLALLGVNLFMWLTYLFGIMDYQPM